MRRGVRGPLTTRQLVGEPIGQVPETEPSGCQSPRAPWNATSSDDVKYNFDAVVAPGLWGLPSVYTFGGDRETFDFSDPTNFTRVGNDVWRYTPLLDLVAIPTPRHPRRGAGG